MATRSKPDVTITTSYNEKTVAVVLDTPKTSDLAGDVLGETSSGVPGWYLAFENARGRRVWGPFQLFSVEEALATAGVSGRLSPRECASITKWVLRELERLQGKPCTVSGCDFVGIHSVDIGLYFSLRREPVYLRIQGMIRTRGFPRSITRAHINRSLEICLAVTARKLLDQGRRQVCAFDVTVDAKLLRELDALDLGCLPSFLVRHRIRRLTLEAIVKRRLGTARMSEPTLAAMRHDELATRLLVALAARSVLDGQGSIQGASFGRGLQRACLISDILMTPTLLLAAARLGHKNDKRGPHISIKKSLRDGRVDLSEGVQRCFAGESSHIYDDPTALELVEQALGLAAGSQGAMTFDPFNPDAINVLGNDLSSSSAWLNAHYSAQLRHLSHERDLTLPKSRPPTGDDDSQDAD